MPSVPTLKSLPLASRAAPWSARSVPEERFSQMSACPPPSAPASTPRHLFRGARPRRRRRTTRPSLCASATTSHNTRRHHSGARVAPARAVVVHDRRSRGPDIGSAGAVDGVQRGGRRAGLHGPLDAIEMHDRARLTYRPDIGVAGRPHRIQLAGGAAGRIRKARAVPMDGRAASADDPHVVGTGAGDRRQIGRERAAVRSAVRSEQSARALSISGRRSATPRRRPPPPRRRSARSPRPRATPRWSARPHCPNADHRDGARCHGIRPPRRRSASSPKPRADRCPADRATPSTSRRRCTSCTTARCRSRLSAPASTAPAVPPVPAAASALPPVPPVGQPGSTGGASSPPQAGASRTSAPTVNNDNAAPVTRFRRLKSSTKFASTRQLGMQGGHVRLRAATVGDGLPARLRAAAARARSTCRCSDIPGRSGRCRS